MENRIIFKDNPWPKGHALKTYSIHARLALDEGLMVLINLKIDNYYAEDEDLEDESEELGESDWTSKIVWNNYHRCTMESSGGIVVAVPNNKLDLTEIQNRCSMGSKEFDMYLLGHDTGQDKSLVINATTAGNPQFLDLEWKGKIALTYSGDYEYAYEFKANFYNEPFPLIYCSSPLNEEEARKLLKQHVVQDDWFRYEENPTGIMINGEEHIEKLFVLK